VEEKLPDGSLSLVSSTEQERLGTRAFQTVQGLTKRLADLSRVSDSGELGERLQVSFLRRGMQVLNFIL
jgi:hypothetical protein